MNHKIIDSHKYDDIINLPRHISKRPHMKVSDRAAQFAPFAALTGHDAAIKETARLTDEKIELDENAKSILDEKLRIINEHLNDHPSVSITFFQPDNRKSGGSYVTILEQIKKVDGFRHSVIMESGLAILFEMIYDIDGEIFGG